MKAMRVLCFLLACPALALGQASHTICDVQEYDSQGLSPLNGEVVTIRGAVTFPPGYLTPLYTSFYLEADACGVSVFSFEQLPVGLALGDSLEVTGEVTEYIGAAGGATTEIVVAGSADVEILSTGNPDPPPADIGIGPMQVEDNEGRLLRTAGIVTDTDHDTFFDLADWTGTLRVDRLSNESVSFASCQVNDTLRVSGILYQLDLAAPWLEGYRLVPRFQEDIQQWHWTALTPTSWGRVKALHRD